MAQDDFREGIGPLRELVNRHRVYYEVWPENLALNEKTVKVGFDLQLNGVHEHAEGGILPGCHHCQQVYDDLRRIAEWIMPKEERPSAYEIEPFDRSLHQVPRHGLRLEVALTMKILHRHNFDQPVDACEERCLKEMRGKLADLGVKEGNWAKA